MENGDLYAGTWYCRQVWDSSRGLDRWLDCPINSFPPFPSCFIISIVIALFTCRITTSTSFRNEIIWHEVRSNPFGICVRIIHNSGVPCRNLPSCLPFPSHRLLISLHSVPGAMDKDLLSLIAFLLNSYCVATFWYPWVSFRIRALILWPPVSWIELTILLQFNTLLSACGT